MKCICDERLKISKTSLREDFHTQERADGRSAFSDGTEKEDELVARSGNLPPFQTVY